jgi:predicted RNA-binding protein YlqC (UPF0109 family)
LRSVSAVDDFVAWVARGLVDNVDAVRVERIDDGDLVVLRLHVAPGDVGRVVGRRGRIARALRTFVRSAGAREDRRVMLDIVE